MEELLLTLNATSKETIGLTFTSEQQSPSRRTGDTGSTIIFVGVDFASLPEL